MKHISFYLDFISPYAYLAFEELPQALMGLSYAVTYKPILFGALLKHHGHQGPAEIPFKRDWTYRQVLWLAQQRGLPMDMPALHPFNPLGLLRLAIAADAERLRSLTATLAPARDSDDASVKAQLKSHTDEAIAAGVFGVPAFGVDDKVFWGLDALPMLRQYLEGNPWFDGPQWNAAAHVPSGITRR